MIEQFWREHPALLAAISLLIGFAAVLFGLSSWTLFLFALYLIWQRKWASLTLIGFGIVYAVLSQPNAKTPAECTARFSISTLQPHQTPFHKNLIYRGTLYVNRQSLPCKIAHPISSNRPLANRDYKVTGTLIDQDAFSYLFKPKEWVPIENSWSPAELRFQTKAKVSAFIKKHLRRPKTANFIASLITGESSERQIAYEFGRLGLQHLLAISGFHFGILLAFLSLCFRFFLSSPYKWGALLFFMSGYFLFIGSSPAVQRSWITACLFIIAKWTQRKAVPLNILGAAMGIELLWNPLSPANLGFQFSFGSCFGILLLYPPLENALRRFLPKRKEEAALTLSPLAQIAYLITSFLRRSFSLTLAVNITILPLLFIHFGKYPLLSLLYNLFFPPLVGFALIGFLTALTLFYACGFTFLFSALDWFCAQLLDLTSYPPLILDRAIYCRCFPEQAIPFYFAALLAIGIFLSQKQKGLHFFQQED